MGSSSSLPHRAILPSDHFEERSYNYLDEDKHWSYDELLIGKAQGRTLTQEEIATEGKGKSSTSHINTVKVLARGSSRSVDKLLCWIVSLTTYKKTLSSRLIDS